MRTPWRMRSNGPAGSPDTNVLISALEWGGKPEACVEQVL